MPIAPPPGDLIQHALENNGVTAEDLIAATGINHDCLASIFAVEHGITEDTAIKLSDFLVLR